MTVTARAVPSTPAATSTVPAKTAAPATPRAVASQTSPSVSGDGQYLVGQDIKAGTYKTTGPADGSSDCYWERTKDASGDMNSIIANDNLAGSGIVTLKRGEYFKSQGCQNWSRVG